ncbi:MAG TPA: hypothetical protein VN890_09475 [Methylocella sp.]|nr:hypothetical protein [Methylocella sp.]
MAPNPWLAIALLGYLFPGPRTANWRALKRIGGALPKFGEATAFLEAH